MQMKERLIEAIQDLPPQVLMDVYEIVLDLRGPKTIQSKEAKPTFLEVQEILKKCPGSLSDDIHQLREDRI